MRLETDYIVKKLLEKVSIYSVSEIESAAVNKFLSDNKIKQVKNLLVLETLNAADSNARELKDWLEREGLQINLDVLQRFYELQVEEEDRKVNGSYYTPSNIVARIIERTIKKPGLVCDPACGSGAFLLSATKRLKQLSGFSYSKIYSRLIFGVDILPTSIHKASLLLTLLAIVHGEDRERFNFNLFVGNSLAFDWQEKVRGFKGFDYVVGNPPYVRTKNLRDDIKKDLARWVTGTFGNVDLYIPFFEIAISIATRNGRVGYITPNTYLSSLNGRLLRGMLRERKIIEEILDFNGFQVFRGATTYTCITILNLRGTKKVKFAVADTVESINHLEKVKFHYADYENLGEDEWRLLPPAVLENIRKIESIGLPLDKYAKKVVTGIATLRNDLFLVKEKRGLYLMKAYKGKNYLIEKGLTRKIIKPNKTKRPEDVEKNMERVIYPYFKSGDKIKLIPEQKLKKDYPKGYQYLRSIKNELIKRDKGKKEYNAWYAYGRTQGLDGFGEKIVFPMMGDKPSFVLVQDKDALIYCGYAIYPRNNLDKDIILKVLNSEIMWYYLKYTSKNYSGGYKSFAKNYIKNFSIPSFSKQEVKVINGMEGKELNRFLLRKFQIRELQEAF